MTSSPRAARETPNVPPPEPAPRADAGIASARATAETSGIHRDAVPDPNFAFQETFAAFAAENHPETCGYLARIGQVLDRRDDDGFGRAADALDGGFPTLDPADPDAMARVVGPYTWDGLGPAARQQLAAIADAARNDPLVPRKATPRRG